MLAIGAHPDDIEIGAGGLLLGLAESRPLQARYVVLTGTAERQAEARAAARAFLPGADLTVDLHQLPEGRLPAAWAQVKEVLEEVARSCSPDVILAPSAADAHQDHRTIGEIVPTVFRDQLFLAYEIPKWDGDLGRPSLYVPLSEEDVRHKVELLHKCYPVAARPGLVGRRGIPRAWPGCAAWSAAPGTPRRSAARNHCSCRLPGTTREGPDMTTLLIDPALPGEELRQQLYDGNLVILTRLRALADFVDYTRGELTELFAPYDPEHVHEHIDPAGMADDPGRLETALHSLRDVQEAGPGGHRGGWLRARTDPLRSAQAADLVPGRAPDHRRRLRVPVAPRRVVQRPRPAD